jgi:hypothetical protein
MSFSSNANTNRNSIITTNNITSSNDEFQQKIDNLLQLVTSCNDDNVIEDAVSSILGGGHCNDVSSDNPKRSGGGNDDMYKDERKMKKRKIMNVNNNNTKTRIPREEKGDDEEIIIQDEDDYDDDEEEENVTKGNNTIIQSRKENEQSIEPKWTGPKATISSIEQQEQFLQQQKLLQSKNNSNKNSNNSNLKMMELNQTFHKVNDIPLGKIGARMMITFGDNIHTDPSALTTALNGTRKCLQNAIQDARALKRKMKNDYERAKVMVNLHRAKRKQRSVLKDGDNECNAPVSGNVDPSMLFEAIGGYSKVGYDSKCGFDDIQLEKLFPEEMRAYRRWRKMHKAYTDNDDGEISKVQEKQDDDDGDDDDSDDDGIGVSKLKSSSTTNNSHGKTEEWGGHLKDRMAQFDTRTERMKEEWYMAFSVVRQGSFLSKSSSAENREWEKSRKKVNSGANGCGRGKRRTSWESLPASYVQFLHWIGFDHRSALPPPNEETAEALAFLGYDFMGKIIEKAIFLRCLEKREQQRLSNNEDGPIILELEPGEQLTKEDIEKALNDSTVGAKPLYCATNSVLDKGSSIQLYFGPGFEDRIEMELEQ